MSEKKGTKIANFILDIILVPAKSMKMIIGINLIIVVLAVMFFYYHKIFKVNHFLFPDVYTSAATLILLDTNIPIDGSVDYFVPNSLEEYTVLGQRKSYDKLVLGLLVSNTIIDHIILKLKELEEEPEGVDTQDQFRENDDPGEKPPDNSLLRNLIIKDAQFYFDDNGFLIISYTHNNPAIAKAIVDEFISQLGKVYNGLMLTKAKIKRQHIENRVKDVEEKLKQAREHFIRFQKSEGVILPEVEASALISSITELYNQIIEVEVELEIIRQTQIEKSKEQKLKLYLQEKKKQLNQLLYGPIEKGNDSFDNVMIPKYNLPDLSLEYLDLKRELEIQEALYNTLINQLEVSRIEEKSELPILQVLDPPEISIRTSGPHRKMFVIIILGMSIILSLGMAYYSEFMKTMKTDPEIVQKLTEIKSRLSLFGSKKRK
ncbi:MAG: hypothetical protein JXJ04_04075 [Spirochaetales bacterium]|nr:hypothetical protein [Spirochaetales bacterium]